MTDNSQYLNAKAMNIASNKVFFPNEQDVNSWKADVSDYFEKKNNFQGVAEPYKKISFK